MKSTNWRDMGLYRIVRRSWKVICLTAIVLLVIDQSGAFLHLLEEDFESFEYPLNVPNLQEIVEKRVNGIPVDEIQPINIYHNRFIIENKNKCASMISNKDVDGKLKDLVLVYVIKSSLTHRSNRDTIRKTWGYEGRFSDVTARRVFILGSCQSLTDGQVQEMAAHLKQDGKSCQDIIDEESSLNEDIVQGDFLDTYFNNTYKTMMGMKWLMENCQNSQFYLFIDDDYYLSTKNLLKFLRNPFLEDEQPVDKNQELVDPLSYKKSKYTFDGRLFAGFVFPYSSPMRHKLFSKWFISLQEYPYSRWPPYVTAGAFVLSNLAFKEMFYASNYVKHFRFDDIYLGILAKKINLSPFHNPNFYFWKKDPNSADFGKVIASHGFSNSQELIHVWSVQKSHGNA